MQCHGNTGISHLEVLCKLGSAFVNKMDITHLCATTLLKDNFGLTFNCGLCCTYVYECFPGKMLKAKEGFSDLKLVSLFLSVKQPDMRRYV